MVKDGTNSLQLFAQFREGIEKEFLAKDIRQLAV